MKKRGMFIVSLITVLVVALASTAIAFSLRGRAKLAGEEESEGGTAWSGMDESVVEAYAAEHGREAGDPLLPVEEGDILLFLFCIGGFLAGLVVGFTWRKVLGEGAGKGKARVA